MNLNATTALFPGDTYDVALAKMATLSLTDAGLPISMNHVQLCPQNHGKITRPLLSRLKTVYPSTVFRLHATCRLARNGYQRFEASTPLTLSRSYFGELAELSTLVGAPAYSMHAGKRDESTLEEMKQNVLAMQDVFECPLAVEGLYPIKGNRFLISTWCEYQWLMESGLLYALDMSQLNIVATRLKRWDFGFVTALLQHPNCIEIHVSSNNKYSDRHLPIDRGNLPVWWALLESANNDAVIFSESNQRKQLVMR